MNVKARNSIFFFLIVCTPLFVQAQNASSKTKTVALPVTAAQLKKEQKRIADSTARANAKPKLDAKEILFLPKAKSDSINRFEDSLKALPPKSSPEVDNLIKFAKRFLGVPYRYGGTTPSGFDCSGFIYYIMGNFGFSTTRTSYGLADMGRNIKLSDARPGDLIFFKGRNVNSSSVGHVGIISEVNEEGIFILHASTSRGVIQENFKTSKYLIPRYLKVKRLDFGEE